jgi:hypothetical protein
MPDARPAGQGARLASWAFLVLLLTADLVAVFVLDPRLGLRGGRLPPDAASYALQAASVAHDLDLQYSKADLDRFVAAHGERPGGVFLRSPDRGERIAFGVPVPYAVLAAPVVRFAPEGRAPWLANALFLALACVAATFTLERRIGPTAPLWTAAYAFASVAFAYTFRAGPELFAAALVACAFALAYRGEGPLAARYTEIYDGLLPGERLAGRALVRWMGVGLLAGTAATFHPFYLLLLWPLALAVPEGRRRTGASVLVASALVAVVAWGGLQASAGGGWVPWERGGRLFTPETGFPAVDVPVAAWPAEEGADGLDLHALLPGGLPDGLPGPAVLGWNALFVALGRHLGLLPYFLPVLLGAFAFLGERGRWAIAPAVLLALAGTLLASPYAFSSIGGSGADAPGNAFFLPLYPALWFLAARPLRAAWPVVAALAAGLALYPAWLDPAAAGAGRTGASVVAERVLPFESTQTGLPGVRDVQLGALWVRFEEGTTELGSGDTLWLDPGQEGSLWLGSPVPVAALALELMPGGPSRAEVAGAEIARTVLSPDGGVSFVLDPGEPDRRHTVAWSSTPYAFYGLTVSFPDAAGERIGFSIEPRFRDATGSTGEPGQP